MAAEAEVLAAILEAPAAPNRSGAVVPWAQRVERRALWLCDWLQRRLLQTRQRRHAHVDVAIVIRSLLSNVCIDAR